MTYKATQSDKVRNTDLQRICTRLESLAYAIGEEAKGSIHQIPADNAKHTILRAIQQFRAKLEIIGAAIDNDIKEERE